MENPNGLSPLAKGLLGQLEGPLPVAQALEEERMVRERGQRARVVSPKHSPSPFDALAVQRFRFLQASLVEDQGRQGTQGRDRPGMVVSQLIPATLVGDTQVLLRLVEPPQLTVESGETPVGGQGLEVPLPQEPLTDPQPSCECTDSCGNEAIPSDGSGADGPRLLRESWLRGD